MNRILIAAFAVTFQCGSLMAQSPQPSSGSTTPKPQSSPSAQPAMSATASDNAANTSRIAPGSVIPVELTKAVDARKVKPGDEVVAKVTQDLKNNAGAVIVPKNTKVIGHVTEAEARSKEQKESQLAIAFDHAVLKNGEAMQMPMSIQAIIAPPNANNASTAQPGGQPTTSYPEPGGGSTAPGAPAGRPSMGGATASGASVPQTTGGVPTMPTDAQPRQPITGNTQGVVGIPNLKLSAAADATQGSVVTSEKNNVKLDDGTFLLLRVNP